MLYVDKFRPKSFKDLDYHKDQAQNLKNLVSKNDFPHLVFYGPPGAGKKTRIMCLLREIYGSGVDKLHIDRKSFEIPSGKKLEVLCLVSNYHIELNPSDVGFHDRSVVMDVVKSMAQTGQVLTKSERNFKVVLLTGAEKLSRDAQNALRRTMEKYSKNCRIILSCNSISKLSAPLRSRCLCVRVAAPTNEQVVSILNNIGQKEFLTLPTELAQIIAEKSERNLRRAILCLEMAKSEANSNDLKGISAPEYDWQIYLKETATKMLQLQSAERLKEIRLRFYELLTHLIPPDVIFKGLVQELILTLDDTMKTQVIAYAAEYDAYLNLGSKPIFHLEAFAAKFMFIYRQYVEKLTTAMDFD